MTQQVHKVRKPTHPRPYVAPHPHLPPDAHIGHDQRIMAILQSYQDQIPEGTEGHGTMVMAYAVGPNPSVDGDFLNGEPRPHYLVYFWTEVSDDAPLSMSGFDYIIERINEGKTTYND